jgi:hypothetical protein
MVPQPDPGSTSARELLQAIPGEDETSRHLLKVASSVTHDAQTVWAALWAQLKPYVTPAGVVLPGMDKGFVPACGWPEFLEQFWLLKHYLDSIDRVCKEKR